MRTKDKYNLPLDTGVPNCDDQKPVKTWVGRGLEGYGTYIGAYSYSPGSHPEFPPESQHRDSFYVTGWKDDPQTGDFSKMWTSPNIHGGRLYADKVEIDDGEARAYYLNFRYTRGGDTEWTLRTPLTPYVLSGDDVPVVPGGGEGDPVELPASVYSSRFTINPSLTSDIDADTGNPGLILYIPGKLGDQWIKKEGLIRGSYFKNSSTSKVRDIAQGSIGDADVSTDAGIKHSKLDKVTKASSTASRILVQNNSSSSPANPLTPDIRYTDFDLSILEWVANNRGALESNVISWLAAENRNKIASAVNIFYSMLDTAGITFMTWISFTKLTAEIGTLKNGSGYPAFKTSKGSTSAGTYAAGCGIRLRKNNANGTAQVLQVDPADKVGIPKAAGPGLWSGSLTSAYYPNKIDLRYPGVEGSNYGTTKGSAVAATGGFTAINDFLANNILEGSNRWTIAGMVANEGEYVGYATDAGGAQEYGIDSIATVGPVTYMSNLTDYELWQARINSRSSSTGPRMRIAVTLRPRSVLYDELNPDIEDTPDESGGTGEG